MSQYLKKLVSFYEDDMQAPNKIFQYSFLKGIVQRKVTGVKKISSNDRYSFGDGVLGNFLYIKGCHLGFC